MTAPTRREVRSYVFHRIREGLGTMFPLAHGLTEGVMEELERLGVVEDDEVAVDTSLAEVLEFAAWLAPAAGTFECGGPGTDGILEQFAMWRANEYGERDAS